MRKCSKREVVKKFDETEYGSKLTRWVYMAIFISMICIAICGSICIITDQLTLELEFVNQIRLQVLKILTFISVVCMCYFYGKRDGAIDQLIKKEEK